MDTFIEKKADLRDPDGSWQAYRRLLRAYTASQLYGEHDGGNQPPPVSAESSSRSMRHAPVLDGTGSSSSHRKHSRHSVSQQQSKSDVGESEASHASASKRPEPPARLVPRTRLDPNDPGFIEKEFKSEENSETSPLAKAAFDVDVDVLETDL